MSEKPRVVIIGAGFAGLWAARALSRADVHVTLIDRNNYHTFLPLLYQVAAAELKPEDISYPVRGLVRGLKNAEFLMDCVNTIDPVARTIHTTRLTLSYDYLIIGVGSTSNYYGIPGALEHTLPLKTLEDGAAIRNHFLGRLERAAYEKDRAKRLSLLTFVIVGGGPTGVEYAGALAELVYGPIVKDYPQIDTKEISIIVLEGLPKLLNNMPDTICTYTRNKLETMGIHVRVNAQVTSIDQDHVFLKDNTKIATHTVVWTAGVKGIAAASQWGMQLSRDGRIMVKPTLQTEGYDNIYVAGDLAAFLHNGKPLPTIAPVAVQEGRAAGRNIIRQIQGQPLVPFAYKDRGAMVTIGRNAAVAYIGGRSFTGFIAWLLWLAVHIFNLIGIPNRLVVMLEWAMDYFFLERVVRLILPGEKNCTRPDGKSEGSSCNL